MVFTSDPARYRNALAVHGYVHLKGVLSKDFIACLTAFYRKAMADGTAEHLAGHVAGKKRQFVFDFPSDAAAEEFRAGMAALTGLNQNGFTISERHLKVYDAATNPWPAPHKDRAASHFSIGIPVHLSDGSTVCLFPTLDRSSNGAEHAVFLTARDNPDLADIYEREEAVMLNEKVGDMVVFNGSAIFHERVRGAGTAVLYIKVNDEGRDPLGENIFHRVPEPAE